MENYWLRHLRSITPEDLPWDPTRIDLLNSFVDAVAEFGVTIEESIGRTPFLLPQQCIDMSIDPQKALSYVFLDLFRKSVLQANGIAAMIELNLPNQAFQMWRTLFESRVVVRYFEKYPDQPELACRYIVCNICRLTVRRWENWNALCNRMRIPGRDVRVPQNRIDEVKEVYYKVLRKPYGPNDYAWTNGCTSFDDLASRVKVDLLFHRMASSEVHPSFGYGLGVAGHSEPLPVVPLIPMDVTHSVHELLLEFQTADQLRGVVESAATFIPFGQLGSARWDKLRRYGDDVLRDMRQSNGDD